MSCSSTEVEYRALAHTAADLAWIRQVLVDLHMCLPAPPIFIVTIYLHWLLTPIQCFIHVSNIWIPIFTLCEKEFNAKILKFSMCQQKNNLQMFVQKDYTAPYFLSIVPISD